MGLTLPQKSFHERELSLKRTTVVQPRTSLAHRSQKEQREFVRENEDVDN